MPGRSGAARPKGEESLFLQNGSFADQGAEPLERQKEIEEISKWLLVILYICNYAFFLYGYLSALLVIIY